MAVAVLKRANTAYQEWAQDAPGVFSAQVLPLFTDAPATRWASDAPASAHRRWAEGGWSAVPLTVVQQAPVPLPPEDVPVYSIAVEPSSSRGELRWAGRLICFMTALATGSAMVAALVL